MKKCLALLGCVALLAGASFAQQETAPDPQLTAVSETMSALPAGTTVTMKLETGISTAVNKVGDPFAGRVTADVTHNGRVVIPVGSSIQGRVTRLDDKRRYKGRPTLELRPETVTLPNGEKYNMVAMLTGTDRESGAKVDNEGRVVGSGIDKRDKLEMAGGAGGGALMGGLIAKSGKGTLIGATIGGGSAVIYWLSKRKSASLVAGTEIVMELSRPMTMNMASD